MGHIFDMFNSDVGSSSISLCLFKRYEAQEEKDTGDTKYQIKPKRDLRSQFLLQMENRERRKREELEEKAKEAEKCAIEVTYQYLSTYLLHWILPARHLASSPPSHGIIGYPTGDLYRLRIRQRLVLKSLAELDSDHYPVLLNLEHAVSSTDHSKKPDLKCTDWDRFANVLREKLGPTRKFRTAAEIDYGVEFITSTIKEAFEASTLRYLPNRTLQASLPDYILRHVREKNWLRRAWKILSDPVHKANCRRKVHAVREMV
uniref:Uncharacterized protein n=1 Tax=Timema shepardi TaxID=629360 RepID=A0A7R9BA71_TIMSH|nr:unnamed protein product [Timema shepardi]